jgi:hypothetical protein
MTIVGMHQILCCCFEVYVKLCDGIVLFLCTRQFARLSRDSYFAERQKTYGKSNY